MADGAARFSVREERLDLIAEVQRVQRAHFERTGEWPTAVQVAAQIGIVYRPLADATGQP